jgi:hypothetical protein
MMPVMKRRLKGPRGVAHREGDLPADAYQSRRPVAPSSA